MLKVIKSRVKMVPTSHIVSISFTHTRNSPFNANELAYCTESLSTVLFRAACLLLKLNGTIHLLTVRTCIWVYEAHY